MYTVYKSHRSYPRHRHPLFYADGTTLFGYAKKSVSAVTEELKAL